MVVGTITFSAIRSNPHTGVRIRYTLRSRYAVGVSAKRSTHTVDLANMVVGTITFSAIRSNPHSGVCSRYTVRSRYAVCSRF